MKSKFKERIITEYFENFLYYGIKMSNDDKQKYQEIILQFLFFLPIVFIPVSTIFEKILIALLLIIYIYTFHVVKIKYKYLKYYYYLRSGYTPTLMSIGLLIYFTICFRLVISDKNFLIVKAILIFIYIVFFALYMFIVYYNIRKDNYNTKDNKQVSRMGIWFFCAFGVMGISIAKVISKNMTQKSMIELVGIICLFLSIMTMIGTVNIWRFVVLYNRDKKGILEEKYKSDVTT